MRITPLIVPINVVIHALKRRYPGRATVLFVIANGINFIYTDSI